MQRINYESEFIQGGSVPFITFGVLVFIFRLISGGLFLNQYQRENVKHPLFFVLKLREAILIGFVYSTCSIYHF
jgi:hypothetical protein